MRRQIRPFTVEVKQKRGNQKRSRSIWGDLDLSAIAAETTKPEALDPQDQQLVDSSVAPVEFVDEHNSQAEHHMAGPKEAEAAQSPTEAPIVPDAPEAKKKAPRLKVARARPKRSARSVDAQPAPAETSSFVPTRTTRRMYSAAERSQKLDQIEKSIGGGDSVKSATKQVGISEQTYYQWKKAAAPSAESSDLKDLVALEEENKRLKGLLLARLRKENAELKKKLGLD